MCGVDVRSTMVSKALPAVLFVLLLATAGCLGTTVNAPAATGANTTRTIDVSATGSASAAPDLAKVNVVVEARAATADAARAQVASNVSRMRDAIRALGIPDDAVRTTAYTVGPEYDYSGNTRRLLGYRAQHAFEIDADVDAAGQVIDAAVGNGASQVQGVQFTLSDATRRQLRQEALSQAMAHAHADAQTIADAGGVAVGQVHSASTGDVGPVPYQRAAPETSAGSGGSTVVSPGPVEVTATVSVSYEVR